jgi:hypothetical protein
MKKFYVIEAACASIALSLALCLANGTWNPGSILTFAALSAALVCGICIILKANRADYEEKARRGEFADYLSRISYRNSGSCSHYLSILKAADGIECGSLKEMVAESFRRNLMGERFPGRLASLFFGQRESVDDAVASRELYVKSKHAEIDATAQRYATLNMFISTIAPSFLVFAFIGDGILSHSGFDTLMFSLVLLVVLPFAYSIGNLMMWRKLHV